MAWLEMFSLCDQTSVCVPEKTALLKSTVVFGQELILSSDKEFFNFFFFSSC